MRSPRLSRIAAALAGLAVAGTALGAQPTRMPLVVKQPTGYAVGAVKRIVGLGMGGIAVIDRDNVLWSSSRTSSCTNSGFPIPLIPVTTGSTPDASTGWQKVFDNVADADVPLRYLATLCGYDAASYVLTLDKKVYAGGAYNSGSCTTGLQRYQYWSSSWVLKDSGVETMIPQGIQRFWSIKAGGAFYNMGTNSSGELGTSTTATGCSTLPYAARYASGVAKAYPWTVNSTSLILTDGTLVGMGRNDNGQFGFPTTGTIVPAGSATAVVGSWTPVSAPGTFAKVKDYYYGVSDMSTTMPTNVILKTDGTLAVSTDKGVTYTNVATGVTQIFVYDSNTQMNATTKLPVYFLDTANNLKMVSGTSKTVTTLLTNVHSFKHDIIGNMIALKKDGTVWVKGPNAHGQLGTGTTTAVGTFTQIASNVVEVAIGWYSLSPFYGQTAFIKADGTLWVAGWSSSNDVLASYNNVSVFHPNLPGNTIVPTHFQLPTPGTLGDPGSTP